MQYASRLTNALPVTICWVRGVAVYNDDKGSPVVVELFFILLLDVLIYGLDGYGHVPICGAHRIFLAH